MPESTIENGMGSVGNTGNNSKDEASHGSRPKNNTGSMGVIEAVEPIAPWDPPPEELQTHAIKQRPYFKTYNSWFSLDDRRLPPGLYYNTAGKDGASNSDI